MYELKQLGSQSYYIESPAKIGIYKQNDTDIYMIDSGNDKEAGKKVLKIANQNNWRIKAYYQYAFQCRPYRRKSLYTRADRLSDIYKRN